MRSLIEAALNDSGNFPKRAQVEAKIKWLGRGLFHDNYRFWIEPSALPPEQREPSFVLRMMTRRNSGRSPSEARTILAAEIETLKALRGIRLRCAVPELVCAVSDPPEELVGLIETWLPGVPLDFFKDGPHTEKAIGWLGETAAEVHRLPCGAFAHLRAHADGASHVRAQIEEAPVEIFAEYPEAQQAKEWIGAHLPVGRPSVVLHGDLLPQNLLYDFTDERPLSLVDWECAQIGDPAYDLAIITRGRRKLLGNPDGAQRLLESYRQAGGHDLSLIDVRIHELLLVLHWLCESARQRSRGILDGHGPEFYAQQLAALLHRLA